MRLTPYIKDTRGKVQKILLMIMDVTDQRERGASESLGKRMLRRRWHLAVATKFAPVGLIRN